MTYSYMVKCTNITKMEMLAMPLACSLCLFYALMRYHCSSNYFLILNVLIAVIIIPHGSFVAYLGVEKNKNMSLPYFGNKAVLDWEQDRIRQNQWLKQANINTPPQYDSIENTEFPAIVKSFGAAGGAVHIPGRDCW